MFYNFIRILNLITFYNKQSRELVIASEHNASAIIVPLLPDRLYATLYYECDVS